MSATAPLGGTIEENAHGLRTRDVTSAALTEATLDGLESLGRRLNAVARVEPDHARAHAADRDARLRDGADHGPLFGVPLAHKDLYLRQGWTVEAGGNFLTGVPAGETAHVCQRLDAAGSVDCARLNTVEFGLGTTGHNEITGNVHNPWNPDYITGGSSSGSAAAVAAGLVPAALGSDTGGSVRLPAAACGLVGLKPTFGLIGRSGVFPLAHSLDTVGPLTRTARDCAIMTQALAGHDPADPDSARHDIPDYLAEIDGGIDGVRVGIPGDYFLDPVDGDVAAAFDAARRLLGALGAGDREVGVARVEFANRATTLIIAVEGAAVHGGWLENRAGEYGSQTLGRLMAGLFVPAEAYVRALEFRRRFARQVLDGVFQEVDLLLTPMWPYKLPTIAASDLKGNPDSADLVTASGHCSRPVNLLGFPAITVPVGRCSGGLPIGIQLIGRPFEEALLLRAARAVEREIDFWNEKPKLSVWNGA